ncbi:MAG: hypothetical protein AAFN07_12635 [Pseudomonadota bacterium]
MMWFTLIVSTLFVAGAVSIAINKPAQLPSALAIGSFFALCALVAFLEILKSRQRLRILNRTLAVEVVGQITIEASFWRTDVLGAGLIVVGGLGVWGGGQIDPLFPWLSGLVIAAGLAGALFPRLSGAQPIAISFESTGLCIRHESYRYTIAWEAMAVGIWSINNVEFISINASSPARVALSAVTDSPLDQPRIVAKLEQRFRRTQKNSGSILTINPMRFGVNPLHLVQAIQQCIDDPQARERLVPLLDDAHSHH